MKSALLPLLAIIFVAGIAEAKAKVFFKAITQDDAQVSVSVQKKGWFTSKKIVIGQEKVKLSETLDVENSDGVIYISKAIKGIENRKWQTMIMPGDWAQVKKSILHLYWGAGWNQKQIVEAMEALIENNQCDIGAENFNGIMYLASGSFDIDDVRCLQKSE